MTDDRIKVDSDSTPGPPSRLVLVLGGLAVALFGFLLTADIGEPDPDAISTTSTSASTTSPATTATEVDAVMRTRQAAIDDNPVPWEQIDLPPEMPFVADVGEFRGETVFVGGDLERGFSTGLVIMGHSILGSWFSVGVVTEESLLVSHVEIAPDVIVIAGRARPTTSSPLGDIVVLQSVDGTSWTETRFTDVAMEILSIAIERDAVSVFSAQVDGGEGALLAELPPEYQRVVVEQMARVIGFDGQILVFGPLGMELGRFDTQLIPQGGRFSMEPTYRPVSWRGPKVGPLAQGVSPFGEGLVHAVRRDPIGDLVAQVLVDAAFQEWVSTGDGAWTMVAHNNRFAGPAAGGLGVLGLYYDSSSVEPRLVVLEDLVTYRVDFGSEVGRLDGVFASEHGVMVATNDLRGRRELPQTVTYVDGEWTVTISVDELVAEAADGATVRRRLDNLWPVGFDPEARTVTVSGLDSRTMATLDLGLIVDAQERLFADATPSGLFVTSDLVSWSHTELGVAGRVAVGYVGVERQHAVVRSFDSDGLAIDVLITSPR